MLTPEMMAALVAEMSADPGSRMDLISLGLLGIDNADPEALTQVLPPFAAHVETCAAGMWNRTFTVDAQGTQKTAGQILTALHVAICEFYFGRTGQAYVSTVPPVCGGG